MNNYNLYYHICKYPIYNNEIEYYNVRKFIIDKNKGIIDKCENYQYGKKNITKLKKKIIDYNYDHIYIDNTNFENIPYPFLCKKL